MNSEHVEVLRDLSEVCRAAIKAGDWKVDGACDPDAALRRADAAIAALSAPQSDGEWVLVPKDAIERAIETLENDGDEHGEGRNLRAMLDAAPQPPAEAHCATCACVPGMTPAIRFDTTPAERDGVVRDHLIRMGWSPPAEAQPVAWRFWAPEILGVPYKEWTGWSTDEGFRKHAEDHGWAAEYAYRSDAPSAPLGNSGAVSALRALSDFNPGADEFTDALSCLHGYFEQEIQSDQLNDLSDAIELPDGFRVAEHLPGIWEYQFDIEDEADDDSDRKVSGTSWNHPALAAIAAWSHAYDALAQQPAAVDGAWLVKARELYDRCSLFPENTTDGFMALLELRNHVHSILAAQQGGEA